MASLAVVGNLSLDRVDGGPPRVGGAPFHAARALRALGSRALVVAKCAEKDRRVLLPPLIGLGVPVLWRAGASTACFCIRYESERREMSVDALGDPWTPAEVRGLGRARWAHVGAIARSDFPAELDSEYDPDVLRHVTVLKLAEEEARAAVGEPTEEALRSLGVPEVVVTLGSHGSLVLADGRLERVVAVPVTGAIDPTGAGDGFAVAYLAARERGHAPVAAARRATALVSGLLARRLR
jgi:sugar/nucleoside kinase (ribokinase family)